MGIVLNVESDSDNSKSNNDEQIQLELKRRMSIRGQQVKLHRVENYVEEIIPRQIIK